MDAAVAVHRKLVLLVESEDALAPHLREYVPAAGKRLFRENIDRLDELGRRLAGPPGAPDALDPFLDLLEGHPDYRDADKLVFREMLDEVAARLRDAAPPGPGWSKRLSRIDEDRAALAQIRSLYEKELDRIFARIETRAMTVRRERWDAYVAFLKTLYAPRDILLESAKDVPGLGDALKKPPEAAPARSEMFGAELPPKTVALTFDDGPHPRHTDRILAILKEYDVPGAVFFQLGNRIGTIGPDGSARLGPGAAVSRRVVASGSAVANHTYSHAVLTKLAENEYTGEIEGTSRLLAQVSRSSPTLFRAPYGARNDNILSAVQSRKMKSMMWNVDSTDWADPIPRSIANRVLKVVSREGRGILLFHDIHARTVEALPLVLETLKAQGYRFAAWDGKAFATREPSRSAADSAGTGAGGRGGRSSPYRESFAVVIGIDDYAHWPKLRYAVRDAAGIRDVLIRRFGFRPDRVFTLFDGEATRQNILSLLGDKLADPGLVKRDDRVFVFFAGHGATRRLSSGRDLGYIVPVEAGTGNHQGEAISMTNFQDIAEAIPAKHVLFVMDSCFSGLALTRGAPGAFAKEMARRTARQVFTAGGADQEVADGGPNGHSIFTWTLLQALEGKGELNGDGIITASELFAYVAPVVSSLSRQTPAFGNMPGGEGGEFLFEVRHDVEFLSGDSRPLDDEAIRLNAEIEGLRSALAEKDRANETLRRDLESARSTLQALGAKDGRGGAAPPAETVFTRNDRGMALFREKRYREALGEFVAATQLAPGNALAANNAGFACFKLEEYDNAVAWFEKTVRLDPKRAVAWGNLGDAYAKLGRPVDARRAYERCLVLAPNAKGAAAIRERLGTVR